jgi:TFIIF-interacting CTD phosphatase-like protein
VKKKKTRTLYVILRPGLLEFLPAAKKASLEIAPYTMWPRSLMSDILDRIDPSGLMITHWMTRDSHSEMLKRRLLVRTVMIDHKPEVYGKPGSNAIKVSLISGDENDVELWNLHDFF